MTISVRLESASQEMLFGVMLEIYLEVDLNAVIENVPSVSEKGIVIGMRIAGVTVV